MSRYRAAARRGGRSSARNRARLNQVQTPAEAEFARALVDAGLAFTQNKIVRTAESLSGYYLADFCIPSLRLIVEVDGKPHTGEAAQWRDRLRTEAIERAMPGYRVVRFWNSEVMRDADSVVAGLSAR